LRPVVLSIAGSDCSGGAGIQADLKTIEALSGYAATVVTAITAQNSLGVHECAAVDASLVDAQLTAVFSDLPVAAVKTGLLGDPAVIGVVARALARVLPLPFVLDPVLSSGSGQELLSAAAVEALRSELVPLATLLTPNAPEAALLSGCPVRSLAEAELAGRRMLEQGARAVLIKGGHFEVDRGTDLLVAPSLVRAFPGTFLADRNPRGTGCVYASAIATQLARGTNLEDSIAASKAFVAEALLTELPLGAGRGPTDPLRVARR